MKYLSYLTLQFFPDNKISPLFSLCVLLGSNSYLPLYLAGVSLQSEGQEFLKATLKENPLIWFRLLSVNNAGQIEVVIKMPKVLKVERF